MNIHLFYAQLFTLKNYGNFKRYNLQYSLWISFILNFIDYFAYFKSLTKPSQVLIYFPIFSKTSFQISSKYLPKTFLKKLDIKTTTFTSIQKWENMKLYVSGLQLEECRQVLSFHLGRFGSLYGSSSSHFSICMRSFNLCVENRREV